MMFIDGMIVLSSALVFSLERALYAIISIYLTGKVIDVVQLGFSNYAKMAFIISEKEEEIKNVILHKINRGVTRLSGTGGYTNDKRPVLMCVLDQSELSQLKQIVEEVDPSAFVIVSNSIEVLGKGLHA